MLEALEVLRRMSQDAQERELYEGRLRQRRDLDQIRLDAANTLERGLAEGFEKGMERGLLQGEIRSIQWILKQPLTAEQELVNLSLDDLRQMIARLRSQLEIPGK